LQLILFLLLIFFVCEELQKCAVIKTSFYYSINVVIIIKPVIVIFLCLVLGDYRISSDVTNTFFSEEWFDV
jgi:hypothetical protein